jgi:hypothetical protein
MAKPSGAIEPSDGGLVAIEAAVEGNYARLCFRVPLQPPHWYGDVDGARYQVTVARQFTVDAGETIHDSWVFAGEFGSYTLGDAEASNVAAEWDERDPTIIPVPTFPCHAPAIDEIENTKPRYCRATVCVRKDGAGTAEILGVHIELTQSAEYTEPDPSGAASVELTDRTSNRLYEPDYPVSAWLMQRALCHSMNKIEYESRQSWSVPL